MKPELLVSPSSLSESEAGMIEVSGGRLWLRDVDVVLSDSPSLIFIRMVGGQLTMETCSLTGLSPSPTSNELAMNAGLCLWESGVLKLLNSRTSIKQTDLTHLSQGAINVKGGNLKIEGGIFHNNNPHSSSFPSLRHNILCSEGGEIEIGSLSGGDGKADHPHLWLSSSDCLVSGEDVNVDAPFFIPTLSSSSTSKLNKKEKAIVLTIDGTTLIPCSLFLEVFEVQKDGNEGKMVRIPLSEDSTDSFNESQIEVSLPLSSMSGFDTSLEWCGRLVYGQNETTASFVIQKNTAERITQGILENMKWWLPLVISLTVLFLIVLGIVIVCCCRRRAQKNEQKDAEMNESAQLSVENEKEDVVSDNKIGENSIPILLSSGSIIENEKKEPEQSDDLIDLKEDIIITGDRTTKKENIPWTHPGDDTVEMFVGVSDRKRDGKDEKEELEDVMERPHKKNKRKKKTTAEKVKKEEEVEIQRREEEDGVGGEDDGNVEAKKKRKKKKKGVEGENDHLLIVDGENKDTLNEVDMTEEKERDEVDGELEVKKKKTKKKKKQEEIVEEENMRTEEGEEIDETRIKDEMTAIDASGNVEEGERPKRKKKKKKVEMEMEMKEKEELGGETEIAEMGGEEAHHEEEAITKLKKTKKGKKKRKEESEEQKEDDI
ncbi:hypothetical protein BLNAU_22169 [Blattamonas nauphoetae]|uniref:Uncharacterized protein n=1 Tax=Blattamonas nauphoetae TaxID=2049346 RepID=A0ABQ9WY32_9EUKA|nr:hypothetical protein BLNAU_22169 [Blattamonas nauphoetae]